MIDLKKNRAFDEKGLVNGKSDGQEGAGYPHHILLLFPPHSELLQAVFCFNHIILT